MINKNDTFFVIHKNSLTLRQKLTIKKFAKNFAKTGCDTFSVPFKIEFTPATFKSNVKNKIYLYAFEREMDIPLRFFKKYSASESDIELIITEINTIKTVLKKEVNLVINPFSENPIRLTEEDLKGIKNG